LVERCPRILGVVVVVVDDDDDGSIYILRRRVDGGIGIRPKHMAVFFLVSM